MAQRSGTSWLEVRAWFYNAEELVEDDRRRWLAAWENGGEVLDEVLMRTLPAQHQPRRNTYGPGPGL
jgi:hypothetical protein